ncbi:MMPL family transporter [Miltoncostaea marina]|uniref:MMPL family transporter n=1 Tax=Miltoncostaea marina TaxID=2843215 RepID=UPI001C3CCFDE|nr:MMPL family transporter [Miltoncostaea marina]
MFRRIGAIVAAHPWRVIAVWVLAFALVVPFAPTLADVSNSDQTSFLPADRESVQAQEVADEHFPDASGATSVLVVDRADGGPLTAADRARVGALAERLAGAGIPAVTGAVTGAEQVAPDGTVQLVHVAFDGLATDDPVTEAVAEVRDEVAAALSGGGLRSQLGGEAATVVDTEEAFSSAEAITGVATVVLILLLVGVIFRSPVAALLPIVTIGLVFALATSLVALLADATGFEVDASLTSLLIVVLFGIGTDYILFLLFRYRERLRAGEEGRPAIAAAVHRVGEAIASSALVVIVAFLALMLSDLGSFESMAPGLAISVTVMLLASVTLIPAVVALVGPRVFWPSKAWRTAPDGPFFRRVGGLIRRRPGRVALASGGVLVALAAGSLLYTADYDTSSSLPSDTESSQAFATLRGAFPAGALNPTEVYLSGGRAAARAGDLAARLGRVPGVADVNTPVVSADGQVARVSVLLADPAASDAAMDAVEGPVRAAAHDFAGPGERALVGGTTSAHVDVREAVERDMSVVFPVAALLIAVILGLLLRSLVAPLVLLGAVALGFAATLGAGVAIFQGAAGQPGLLFMLPIMLYLFVIAIGTDYNILMTARLREEVTQGLDRRAAADMAVEHAGPAVASAGVILAGTFASLSLTGVGLLVQMGSAIALGVMIVALLMACLLVPSIAALAGHWFWWPGHRDAPAAEPGGPAAEARLEPAAD